MAYDVCMAFWLLKTEPRDFSWEMLVRDGETLWTGIRNFEARNNLAAMKTGDYAFMYHTGDEKLVIGIAKIMSEAIPDPTGSATDTWLAIKLVPHIAITRPISLEEIRNTHNLCNMPLVTHARLSVQAVTDDHAQMLMKIGKSYV